MWGAMSNQVGNGGNGFEAFVFVALAVFVVGVALTGFFTGFY
jgi:hypothetical protein